MDEPVNRTGRWAYHVRFEGGPRDATQTVVPALETGEPPEVLLTPGRPEWVYILGGAPRADGSLPYWWMRGIKLAEQRRRIGQRPEVQNSTTA
jgi:hypothetical protein